jgi:RNA polymerase sigma-70 factor, ECF subfamily
MHTPAINTAFRQRLMRYARLKISDTASAQDAVQAALEALLKSSPAFDNTEELAAYAIGILQHKIIDIYRDRQRYVSLSASAPHDEDSDFFLADTHHTASANAFDFTPPERHVYALALRQALQQKLRELSAQSRAIFAMREYDGLTHEEIARHLNLTTNHTFVLLHRAKHHLRAGLITLGYEPLLT